MYFFHSDQSKAEKGLSCKAKSAALTDVPPTELQRRKFQKETNKAKQYCLHAATTQLYH